jgi:glycosyltransferase involved in cell wall biosynthesis
MKDETGDRPAAKVSVVMAVYNAERYLREAIDSILNQTMPALELIIVCDPSTDCTPEILNEYMARDERVRVITNKSNVGLAGSLNAGIEAARAELIARQDADDLSHPTRLERQVEFLKSRPDAAVVGTSSHVVDEKGNTVGSLIVQGTEPDKLREVLRRGCPFTHGSVVMRRQPLHEVGMYRVGFQGSEDYDLWLRMSEGHNLTGMPELLYSYRITPEQVTVKHRAVAREFHDLARQFADEREMTGSDSYAQMVSEDLMPSFDRTKARDAANYHRRMAELAWHREAYREALAQVREMVRERPVLVFWGMFLAGKIVFKETLRRVGLLPLFRRIVYAKR